MPGTNSQTSILINDMVMAIGDEMVPGMTEVAAEVALASAGPRLVLTLSRYKFARAAAEEFAHREQMLIDMLDSAARDSRRLGWLEIGDGKVAASGGSAIPMKPHTSVIQRIGGTSLDRPTVQEKDPLTATHQSLPPTCLLQDHSSRYGTQTDSNAPLPHKEAIESVMLPRSEAGCEGQVEDSRQGQTHRATSEYLPASSPNSQVDELAATGSQESFALPGISLNTSPNTKRASSMGQDEDDNNDPNPCNGCICGQTHTKEGGNVFWIQCDACNCWYNVSNECIGFNEGQAASITWNCLACPPSPSSDKSPNVGEEPPKQALDAADPLERSSAPRPPLSKKKQPSKGHNGVSTEKVERKSHTDSASAQDRIEVDGATNISHSAIRHRLARLTSDGCLRPKTAPSRKADGTFRHPSGPRPAGMIWDYARGLWAPRDQGPSDTPKATFDKKATTKRNGKENVDATAPKTSSAGQNKTSYSTGARRNVDEKAFGTLFQMLHEGHGWEKQKAASGKSWMFYTETGKAFSSRPAVVEFILKKDSYSCNRRLKEAAESCFSVPSQQTTLDDGEPKSAKQQTATAPRQGGKTMVMLERVKPQLLEESQKLIELHPPSPASNSAQNQVLPPPSPVLPPLPPEVKGTAAENRYRECLSQGSRHWTAFGSDASVQSDSFAVFEVGDLVMVRSHAWAKKNVEGGVGIIKKRYENDEGQARYDVKYIVGRATAKCIMPEFISHHAHG